jgi:integrase
MSVRTITRKGRKPILMIDFTLNTPDGRTVRHRSKAPIQNRRAAEAEEQRLRQAILAGPPKETKEIPTLATFSKEFLDVYVRNNNKDSEGTTKRTIYKNHLLPAFGRMRLDAIGPRDVDAFSARKKEEGYDPNTVNNFLTVLRKTLAVAVDYEILTHVPKIRHLKTDPPKFDFFDFEEADRLLAATEPACRTLVLVALRTGLRRGELMALRWEDVDLVARRLVVRRNYVRGKFTTPKSGRFRTVDLSEQVVSALKAHRHLRGELVFCHETGRRYITGELRHPLWRACRKAGLRHVQWHMLRHSFASHLTMRGVPLKAVQELLGHATIEMTMRYAHLRRTCAPAPWPAWTNRRPCTAKAATGQRPVFRARNPAFLRE